jgi:hypothetical protein
LGVKSEKLGVKSEKFIDYSSYVDILRDIFLNLALYGACDIGL